MVSANDRLIIWTSPVAKAKVRALLQISKVSARTRLNFWEKRRGQVLDWAGTSLADRQLLPEDVQQQTDILFSVDASGALSAGCWPALPGPWASRKGAEFDTFAQVATWAQALLQLTTPVPGTWTVVSVAGGTASGTSGAGVGGAALSGPVGGAGSGGGILAGTVGVAGAPGIGTVAAAGSAPAAAVSVASVGVGGLGAGVLTGTTGATTGPSTGTAAAVVSTPAAAVDPDVIAAAIATALRQRLDALGTRLAHFEARGAAPAGASLLGGGVVPPEAELLAQALRDSVATVEGWDVARCSQACADLVHEAAKLRPQLTLLKEIRPFEKLPMKALEANAFPAILYAPCPNSRRRSASWTNSQLENEEATEEHWRAFVHLLQARVRDFQKFVKSKVPSFPLTDVMATSFFKKRKRVTFEGEEDEARAVGGGIALLPPLDAARRGQLAALGSSFRTVNEEQLARALRGDLTPEEIVRPPVQRLQQEDEGRIKWKDGDLTLVPKSKKCKDMAEWERGFLRIMCEAPAEAREGFVAFLEWAKSIAADYIFFYFSDITST
ncbi:hypothetical protein CYMTET_12844 [Cymbomonas tetramitiformis]|uniref:Uncharacterized protein n=1 Tax=Cymbomonas tetramitiformis TaxID=36881 RepID=A0AAE0GJH1_9CHLO|nr:hypothetical protein CYMTET_12844 [Cymbomonas tetramitiformis]